MSRLIDADELYNGSMKHEYFDFVEHDNHGRESFAYSCAMQRVAEAPTVDAIPVSFLQDTMNKLQDAYQDVEADHIAFALWLWNRHKEQKGDY